MIYDSHAESWVIGSDVSIKIHNVWQISCLSPAPVCFLTKGYGQSAKIREPRSTSRHLTAMRHCWSRGTCRWAKWLCKVCLGNDGLFLELTRLLQVSRHVNVLIISFSLRFHVFQASRCHLFLRLCLNCYNETPWPREHRRAKYLFRDYGFRVLEFMTIRAGNIAAGMILE